MKRIWFTLLLGMLAKAAPAATTINAASHFSYGANLGWMDWRGDVANGAILGEYVCSGFIYSANTGWINLGSGTPTNGIQYLNLSANDFGVNLDAFGNLRGFAWGANIGWLNFEGTGAPKVNMFSGTLTGFVWSANCGWISLSNAFASVKVDAIPRGADSNGNGIPDAWERQNFGTTGIDPNADPDGDGMSNLQEYLAGTNPNDGTDNLRITYVARGDVLPGFTTLRWTSELTRFYGIQYRATLDTNSVWAESATVGFGGNAITLSTGSPLNTEFYRVRAFRPLTP